MKRQILSIALALCMLLSIVPLTPIVATAETVTPTTVVASGTCGATESDSVTWELSPDGTMTIGGSGKMKDFKQKYIEGEFFHDDCPWKDYISDIKSVVICDGVTSIGDASFFSCSNLTSATFGKDITEIGWSAFERCTNLKDVDIPDGVTMIGDRAFEECSSLTKITIPKGVTRIEKLTFFLCTALSEVVIPEGVTEIGQGAFYRCTALSDISIPNSVTSIESMAFYACTALSKIVIPGNVSSVGEKAFRDCTALTDVTFGGDVAKIGNQAFGNCSSLTDIYLFGEATGELNDYNSNAFNTCFDLSKVYCYDDNMTVDTLTTHMPPHEIACLNGTCGATESDSVTWKLTPDGTLSLSGTGTVADYSSTDAPWKEFADKGMIKNVTIGKNVTFSSLGVSECSYTVSSEAALKAAVGNDGTVILGDNITIGSTLIIEKEITLDLNGHELKYSSTGYGSVIHVNSGVTFTLNDSSPAGTGTVTGGTGFEVVADYGEGIAFKNYYGGGVFNYGDFIMNGGTIKDCLLTTSFEDGTCSFGGGVYTMNDGTFTMNGGSIENCSAVMGAGVYIQIGDPDAPGFVPGFFIMNGGTVKNCTGPAAPAVFSESVDVTFSGNALIDSCTLLEQDLYPPAAVIINKGNLFAEGGTVNTDLAICGLAPHKPTRIARREDATGYTAFNGEVVTNCTYIDDSACPYTVTFDPKGGTEVAAQHILKGQKATEPAAPSKTGWTFGSWYDGETEWNFGTAPTSSITLTASWACAGHVDEDAKDHKCDVCGETIDSCTDPDKDHVCNWCGAPVGTHEDGNTDHVCDYGCGKTFGVCGGGTATCKDKAVCDYCGKPYGEVDSNNHAGTLGEWQKDENSHWKTYSCCTTVKGAEGTHNFGMNDKCECGAVQYTVTFDPNGGTVDPTSATTDVEGKMTSLPIPERNGCRFTGWYTDKTGGTEVTKTTVFIAHTTIYAHWNDYTAPTGEIKLGTNSWKTFLNNITFGLFFKDTQEVTITATDNSGELVTIEYLLSDKELTAEELATATFTAYSDKFNVEPNNEYVIYAKLSDKTGNITYINSNGIVLDNIAPVISGIANGKTYCEAQTVTVSDKYEVTVTVNGTPVTLDANGKFTLTPAIGTQTVVATDKAGNVSAEMIVTINDGHEGGTATCTKKAVCKHCGLEYGEVNNSNHDLEHNKENAATVTTTGNKEYWHCKDCDNNFSDKDGKNVIDLKDTVISKLAPEIIDGKGQSLTAGETRELTFRSNAAYSDFVRVEVDGKTVDENNYTVKEGSTIVTLKADYMATLSVGKHTLGIVSESGTATTTFTVNAKVVNDTTAPQTGDNSHMALWFALLFVSGGALVGTTVYGKKKKYSAK